VYHRHNIKGVCINQTISWKGCSLDFLRRLPDLRSLRLGIDVSMDLTVLGELEGLETLGLTWRVAGSPGEADFQSLSRLIECSISWHPDFRSVLKLKSLRNLVTVQSPSWHLLCSRKPAQLRMIGDRGPLVLDIHLKSMIIYPRIPVCPT
jgi:hypothetical protein